jgi:hypothetical protein
MFSSLPHQCATTRAKSTVSEGSRKNDAHAGALSLAGGALEPAALTPCYTRVTSSSPAATTVRCHPKVSESRSPRRHDAVGEDLVEFGELEHR